MPQIEMKEKKIAIILDDMISSGETIHVLVRMLAEMAIPQIIVGATHNLCMESARVRLVDLHSRWNLTKVIVTDSITQTAPFRSLPFFRVRTLSDILCKLIHRIHCECPVEMTE